MGLKGRINKLTRRAEEGAVILRLRDGSTRAFDDMTCFKEMFMAQYNLFGGEATHSEVLDAVRAATPESRARFEAAYGPVEMEARIIAGDYQGGWVEIYRLEEDGTVTKVRHEGGTPEAERLRAEARRVGPAF